MMSNLNESCQEIIEENVSRETSGVEGHSIVHQTVSEPVEKFV